MQFLSLEIRDWETSAEWNSPSRFFADFITDTIDIFHPGWKMLYIIFFFFFLIIYICGIKKFMAAGEKRVRKCVVSDAR